MQSPSHERKKQQNLSETIMLHWFGYADDLVLSVWTKEIYTKFRLAINVQQTESMVLNPIVESNSLSNINRQTNKKRSHNVFHFGYIISSKNNLT